jgi:hypothetical protein
LFSKRVAVLLRKANINVLCAAMKLPISGKVGDFMEGNR